MTIKEDALSIINESIKKVLPDEAVKKALKDKTFGDGKLVLISVGKASWQMAKAAIDILGNRINEGIVITKYHHAKGELPNTKCYEAGHPVPDENSFKATEEAINLVSNLNENDTVIFLLSGGASALFEKPLCSPDELKDITNQLLSCAANINEINVIRKRLSAVKGGRFAEICKPAKVYSIILSDIVGGSIDMVGSGPTCNDSSTCKDALGIVNKYNLKISNNVYELLNKETPKQLDNIETIVTGSVKELCKAAADRSKELGYEPICIGDNLTCEAKNAGVILAESIKLFGKINKSLAIITGGETVVHLTGKGKGGRNQELVLSGAKGISGLDNVCLFSVGSDGTDGPTDAAGGYVDGSTYEKLKKQGIDVEEVLKNNDSYNALAKVDGLIITGPTGTNVNDVSVLLIKK